MWALTSLTLSRERRCGARGCCVELDSILPMLHLGGATVDRGRANPPVGVAPVVADLKPLAVYRRHKMHVLVATDSDEHDRPNAEFLGITRHQGDEIAVVDLGAHRVTSGPNRHRVPSPQRLLCSISPAHTVACLSNVY